jgi:hypothetical protein
MGASTLPTAMLGFYTLENVSINDAQARGLLRGFASRGWSCLHFE